MLEGLHSGRQLVERDPQPIKIGAPIGWIRDADIPEEGSFREDMAVPMSPLLNRRATLKDALSLLLDADVQAGIVVDRHGATTGLLTVEMIAARMRDTAGDSRFVALAPEEAPASAQSDEPPELAAS